MLKRLWTHRALVGALIRRMYLLRYRQSFGGFVWAIIPALGALAAGSLVFNGVIGVDNDGEPYALMTMAALVPWTLFSSSFSFGVPSIVQSQPMVTRLPFPRASLPIAAVGVSLIDIAVSGTLFVIMAYLVGDGLPLTALWFPALIAIEVVLIVGVVLLGSAANAFSQDVRLAVPLVTQFWLLITPVMYPLNVEGAARSFYLANPMTGLVESFRDILVRGTPPSLELMLPAMVGAVVLLFMGVWYFGATESRFADVI